MIFHKHIFGVTVIMCLALFILFLPMPTPVQHRTGCFTCRCKDEAGQKVILGPICNYKLSLAQDIQDFACNQTAATEQCRELSDQHGLSLVSAHIWHN